VEDLPGPLGPFKVVVSDGPAFERFRPAYFLFVSGGSHNECGLFMISARAEGVTLALPKARKPLFYDETNPGTWWTHSINTRMAEADGASILQAEARAKALAASYGWPAEVVAGLDQIVSDIRTALGAGQSPMQIVRAIEHNQIQTTANWPKGPRHDCIFETAGSIEYARVRGGGNRTFDEFVFFGVAARKTWYGSQKREVNIRHKAVSSTIEGIGISSALAIVGAAPLT